MRNYMKRQTLLLLFLFFGLNANAQSEILKTDWVFIYYMPYDNNLSEYGQQIIKMIQDSISSDKVIATVQADFDDNEGMSRYLISKDTIIKTSISNEYSASTKSYEEYLTWVNSKLKFKHKAIVFLDHGGKLNELCLDEKPVKNFLKVDSLKEVFHKMYKGDKIDILFLQVCSKGSIEPLYEFRGVADYTLCSQIELGAPNYYYGKLFKLMSTKTISNGYDVGKAIVENESYNMYSSYTLIDNSKLDSLKYLFSDFVSELQKYKISLSSAPKGSYYWNEKYWDMVSFLENLLLPDNLVLNAKKTQLINFINKELVVIHKINPMNYKMQGYCGISISRTINENYNTLEFYKMLTEMRKIEIKK